LQQQEIYPYFLHGFWLKYGQKALEDALMKKLASGALLASFLFGIAVPAWADNAWVGYTGVDRSKPQHRPPSRPHYTPQPPHSQRPYYPQRPSHGGYYPPAQSQSGFNI